MESFPTSTFITNNSNKLDEEEEESQMSDLESEFKRTTSTSSSPCSSQYKMSVDSDDARSIPSPSSSLSTGGGSEKIINNWAATSLFIPPAEQSLHPHRVQQQKKTLSPQQKSYDFRERRDPERRIVVRRSSLLPKSKALLRVIDQTDEDTHLADLEMRREHETTAQLNNNQQQNVPAASWTKVPDTTMPLYQCSKLNPEIEMTNFQLENISSSNYKSIKRKASEDRFEPYPTSICLKRRAVSPSVSLNGSPVLSGISPPTIYALYPPSGNNAAAKVHQQKGPSSFNLYDASGGLSRMSLSE